MCPDALESEPLIASNASAGLACVPRVLTYLLTVTREGEFAYFWRRALSSWRALVYIYISLWTYSSTHHSSTNYEATGCESSTWGEHTLPLLRPGQVPILPLVLESHTRAFFPCLKILRVGGVELPSAYSCFAMITM